MPVDHTDLISSSTVAVVSDLHIGDASSPATDQFDADETFARLLGEELPARADEPTTLVLNGDFLDFTQVLPTCWRTAADRALGTTQEESVEKLERIIAGHPRVFIALAEFLDRGNQVVLIPGNHDVDLVWPQVLEGLAAAVGARSNPRLTMARPGYVYERGLYLEHGHQYSRDNRFRHWPLPIRPAPGGPRLERPWGSLFMEHVYRSIPELHPYVYRLLPRRRLTHVLLRSLADEDQISGAIWRKLAPFLWRTGWGPLGTWLREAPGERRWWALAHQLNAEISVLGHTHLPQTRLVPRPQAGRPPLRFFNTGSWIASYPLTEGLSGQTGLSGRQSTAPHWSDLAELFCVAEPRCLWLQQRGAKWMARILKPGRGPGRRLAKVRGLADEFAWESPGR